MHPVPPQHAEQPFVSQHRGFLSTHRCTERQLTKVKHGEHQFHGANRRTHASGETEPPRCVHCTPVTMGPGTRLPVWEAPASSTPQESKAFQEVVEEVFIVLLVIYGVHLLLPEFIVQLKISMRTNSRVEISSVRNQ